MTTFKGSARFEQPRTPKGTYAAFSREVTQLVQAEAEEYQSQVAEFIRDNAHRSRAGVSRWNKPSGQLARATEHPDNREVGKSVWRVGIPRHLDREARYWRTIEFGSAATWRKIDFTQLVLFGNFEAGFPSMYHPYSREKRLEAIARDDRRIFHPGHQIAPMDAYGHVYRGHRWGERTRRDFNQLVGRYF